MTDIIDNEAPVVAQVFEPSRLRRMDPVQRIRRTLQCYSGLVLLIILIVLFSLLLPDTFLSVRTFRTLIADQTVTAIVSLGLLAAYKGGAFDLSVGQGLGLAVVMVAWLQSVQRMSPGVAIALTLGIGALVGVANGIAVTVLRVNSFIATLAMASILEAVIYGVTGGNQIVGGIPAGFLSLGQSQVFGIPIVVLFGSCSSRRRWGDGCRRSAAILRPPG